MFKKLLIVSSFLFLTGCNFFDLELSKILSNVDKIPINNHNVTDNYLYLNLYGEDDFYISSWVWPPNAPYTNIFEITAETNAEIGQEIRWHSSHEYHLDMEDYIDIFDVVEDSITYVNHRGFSTTNLVVTPSFTQDTIYIYSEFVDNNDIYYRDTLKFMLTW